MRFYYQNNLVVAASNPTSLLTSFHEFIKLKPVLKKLPGSEKNLFILFIFIVGASFTFIDNSKFTNFNRHVAGNNETAGNVFFPYNNNSNAINFGSPINPFEEIDKRVRNCPKENEMNIKTLAAYLGNNTENDLEKARAIYVWLTKNINYDDQAYNSRIYGDYSAEGVLKSKKSLCGGFSNLFLALGKAMDLDIIRVIGYSKGYGYDLMKKIKNPDHAWNMIKINGQWRVFDATWGEGTMKVVNGRIITKKEFNDFWFDVDPYIAIFSHLPQDYSLAAVNPEIDINSYQSLPNIDKEYFRLGFNPEETYHTACDHKGLSFPKCYPTGTYIKAIAAPKFAILHLNRTYEFELYIPKGVKVVVLDAANHWTFFEGNNGKFKIHYTPAIAGELQISAKYDNGGDEYYTMLSYNVR